MTNSRAKGARIEREAVKAIREHFHAPECVRAAQVSGKYSADVLGGLPGAHIEVKGHKQIGAFRFLDQADRDRKPDEFPVVVMRENGAPFAVMFRIADTERFVRAVETNRVDLEGGE